MTMTGQCHCGAISYSAEGEPKHHALCHCSDCRHSAGAPMVGWIAFSADKVSVTGQPVTYKSSENSRRQFCGTCGTGLFFTNAEMLPGVIDIQSCTLHDPAATAPQIHIQTAERLEWMDDIETLPSFPRYPGQ